jgi:hypothetical protein
MTEIRVTVGRIVAGEATTPSRREEFGADLSTALSRRPAPAGDDPAVWAEWLRQALAGMRIDRTRT